MIQSKAESGPYTLWYTFDDVALKRRYSTNEYARASQDLLQGAAQAARCYLDVIERAGADALGGSVETAWVALNWEAPGILWDMELSCDRAIVVPQPWVAQEVFWTVLNRRAHGEDRRLFLDWLRVALGSLRSDSLDQDPFARWFGGADVLRTLVKTLWARVGNVLNMCAGLSPSGKGIAPNGLEIEVRRADDPYHVHLGGPDLAWRVVPLWGIDMIAWQTFRDLLVEAADAEAANPRPAPPPPPPPPPPVATLLSSRPAPDPVRPRSISVEPLSPVSYVVISPCEIPGTYQAVRLSVGTVLEAVGRGAVYRKLHDREIRINDACLDHLVAQGWVQPQYSSQEEIARAEFMARLGR